MFQFVQDIVIMGGVNMKELLDGHVRQYRYFLFHRHKSAMSSHKCTDSS